MTDEYTWLLDAYGRKIGDLPLLRVGIVCRDSAASAVPLAVPRVCTVRGAFYLSPTRILTKRESLEYFNT